MQKTPNIAIVAAKGLGDGLIMLIAKNYTKNAKLTIFNPQLSGLKAFFPNTLFQTYPHNISHYLNFDLVILQNDNSPSSFSIIELRKKGLNLSVFYVSHKPSKHPPLHPNDIVFDSNSSMATNVSKGCQRLFKSSERSIDLKFTLPKSVLHKKHSKRVIIHPFSGDIKKNLPLSKLVKLYKKLQKEDLEPIFTASIADKKKLLPYANTVKCLFFDSLEKFTIYLYESAFLIGMDSGPAHLASALKVPLITIADNKKKMILWQAGWQKAHLIFAPSFIINCKLLRLREKKWGFFISHSKIFKVFRKNFIKS